MSATVVEAEPRSEERAQPELGLAVDTLADSVVLLLVLTVVQRLIGFARGMLFCRWLSPEELGRWDVVMAFLDFAAPWIVLGLPGSFGRYVEHFRYKGQLRTFLWRTSITSATLVALGVTVMSLAPGSFSELIFGTRDYTSLVLLVACCLVTVAVHNFICELYAGLRMFRVVTLLQFGHGLVFATVSLTLLWLWRDSASSIVLGYTAAGLLCALLALAGLGAVWQSLPSPAQPVAHREFWGKLMPFAAWVWVANWLSNLFVVVDRYMIVHFCPPGQEPLALAGEYHSSRILPLLLASIATMLATMILPHLSHDWEAGRREEVDARMRLVLKFSGLGLLAGGFALQLAGPIAFEFFKGKFSGGLAVLDWTTMYCIWFGLTTIALCYLWCNEQTWLGSVAVGIGLVVNIVLNYVLLPRLGLFGVVYATAAGNAITLALVYAMMSRTGLKFDPGVWLISAAPFALGFGPWITGAILLAAVVAIGTTPWLLDAGERTVLTEVVAKYRDRLRRRRAMA